MNSELTIENFTEIPPEEQEGYQGGGWSLLGSLLLIVVEEVVSDWENFKNGLTGQPEENNN